MIRHPITIELTGAARGRPVSAHYGYLVGIFPDHYMKARRAHAPARNAPRHSYFLCSLTHAHVSFNVSARLLQVKERVKNVEKAQQVGGFSIMHIEDLKKALRPPRSARLCAPCARPPLGTPATNEGLTRRGVSPPAAPAGGAAVAQMDGGGPPGPRELGQHGAHPPELTPSTTTTPLHRASNQPAPLLLPDTQGDIFNGNGKNGPPWISEMYGYVFACAEVGLDFQVSDKFMLYPGYEPPAPEPWPLVMHYGITYNVMHFAFDKHWRAVPGLGG